MDDKQIDSMMSLLEHDIVEAVSIAVKKRFTSYRIAQENIAKMGRDFNSDSYIKLNWGGDKEIASGKFTDCSGASNDSENSPSDDLLQVVWDTLKSIGEFYISALSTVYIADSGRLFLHLDARLNQAEEAHKYVVLRIAPATILEKALLQCVKRFGRASIENLAVGWNPDTAVLSARFEATLIAKMEEQRAEREASDLCKFFEGEQWSDQELWRHVANNSPLLNKEALRAAISAVEKIEFSDSLRGRVDFCIAAICAYMSALRPNEGMEGGKDE